MPQQPVPTPEARHPRRLLTGPAGSGKTHRALEAVRRIVTEPGPRGRGAGAPGAALLVLPTYAQVMHMKRRALSRWDTRGILDEPFATFTSAGERFLPGFQVRGLPSAEERDRFMEEALRERDVPLFRQIADRPGFRAKLLRLVKELKQTGLPAHEARARMRAAHDDADSPLSAVARARMDGFLRVFEAYEDLLERADLEDHEDALRRLADALQRGGGDLKEPPRLLVVDGFDDFTEVEERILFRLSDLVIAQGGEVCITLPWDEARPLLFDGSAGIRRRLLAAGFREEALQGFPRAADAALTRVASHLFSSTVEPPLSAGTSIQWLIAGDAEDEAETIARTLRGLVADRDGAEGGMASALEGVRGWRDIGIILRQPGTLAPRIAAACERLGVPLRVLAAGEMLPSAPILRALRGPLGVLAGRVEAGRFRAGELMEWLRWLALNAPHPWTVSDLDVWEMSQREHGIPSDFDAFCRTMPEPLQPTLQLVLHARAALEQAETATARYEGLALAIDSFVPLPELSGFDAEGRPQDLAHDARLQHAGTALSSVRSILIGLRAAVERTGLGGAGSLADAVQELEEAMDRTAMTLPDRRLDAVTLMDAEEARYWELPVVFVAGLEEGSMPLRPRQDLILRDHDREILRSDEAVRAGRALKLPLAREKETRERRLFYGALTRARQRLYLSRCAFDDKGESRNASSYVEELQRQVAPTVAVQAIAPGRVLREIDTCYTRSDLQLFAASRLAAWSAERGDVSAEDRALAAALYEALGSTAKRRAAATRRRAPEPLWADESARDGVLERFHAATELVSVSRLNRAVACPQQFFLAYVAGVPSDEFTLDGPVFDARAQGTALHHAFEVAVRDETLSAAEAAAEGVGEVDARGLDERLLLAELTRAVTLLRLRESETAGPLKPWREALELDFTKEKAVPLGTKDCAWRLGGYIDRIDRTAGGEASILDYKRGAASAESAYKKAKEGTDLQLPLYARAIEAMTELRVVGLEWMAGLTRLRQIIHDADASALFAGRREAKAPTALTHEEFRALIQTAEETATAAIREMRGGAYERRPATAALCADCDWRRVCRPDLAWLEREEEARDAAKEDA